MDATQNPDLAAGAKALPAVSEHRKQLDTLRLVAFLMVFCCHASVVDIKPLGAYGVNLFFAISGFVITRVLLLGATGSLYHDLKTFYIRRALRIWPLYYIVLTGLLLAHHLPYAPWFYYYIGNVVMATRGEWLNYSVSPLWSLCIEEQFYVLYPLILLPTPPKLRALTICVLISLSVLSRIFLSGIAVEGFADYLLPNVAQYLLWGALCAWLDINFPKLPLWPKTCMLIGTALVVGHFIGDEIIYDQLWTWFQILSVDRFAPTVLWTLMALGNALIVFGAWRLKPGPLLTLMKLRPLVYLGTITYGMYLLHFPVIEFLDQFHLHSNWYVNRAIEFVAVVAAASLSFYLIENPINRLKSRFPYRKSDSVPQEPDDTPGPEEKSIPATA